MQSFRKRSTLFFFIALGWILISLPTTLSQVQTITGNFSADNSYMVWVGDENQVIYNVQDSQGNFLRGTSTLSSQIRSGEEVTFTTQNIKECYLYLIGWSDDVVYQGIIGAFSGDITIVTGDPRWRVLPTGDDRDDIVSGSPNVLEQWPTQAEINAYITASTPADWKQTTVGPNNLAADDGAEPLWGMHLNNVPLTAKWIWYDSGNDPRANYPASPYVPFVGFNHEEFLIFRIPCAEFFTDLNITKTVNNNPWSVGGANQSFTLTVTNPGPDDIPVGTTIVVRDDLPQWMFATGYNSGGPWVCIPVTGDPESRRAAC